MYYINRALYNVMCTPREPLCYMAILINYPLCAYYYHTVLASGVVDTVTLYNALFWVLVTTGLAYRHVDSAYGVSAVWSFMFGLLPQPTLQDTLLYGVPSVGLLLPWEKWSYWPWPHDFKPIAIVTHAVFAAAGSIVGCACKI